MLPSQGEQVPSPVGELRFLMVLLHSKTKTKTKKTQNPNHQSAPLLSPYLHNFVLLFSSLKCLLVSFALKIQQISSQCQVQVSLLWSLPSQYYCLSSPSIYNWGHTFYYRIVSSSRAKMLNRSLLSVQQNNLDPFTYSFTPQIEHLTSWVRSRFTNPLTWRSLGLDWG